MAEGARKGITDVKSLRRLEYWKGVIAKDKSARYNAGRFFITQRGNAQRRIIPLLGALFVFAGLHPRNVFSPVTPRHIRHRAASRLARGDYGLLFWLSFFLRSGHGSEDSITHMFPILRAVSNEPRRAICLALSGFLPLSSAYSFNEIKLIPFSPRSEEDLSLRAWNISALCVHCTPAMSRGTAVV